MKILIYGINFAPEPIGVGRYTAEMAAYLKNAGHDVRVITALPYYPAWKVDPAYSKYSYLTEEHRGIKVSRAPLWVPFFPGGLKRILHLLSFAVTSLPLLFRAIGWKPHIIWVAAPAIACAPAALLAAKMSKSKTWLHVQDFEIDIAFGMKLVKSGALQRIALAAESAMLKTFDCVSTISKGMKLKALEKGVDPKKFVMIPNWSDLDAVAPLGRESYYRKELEIPADCVVALYSGSMGIKQGIDWLSEIAVKLAHEPDLMFVFCGDGPLKEVAMKKCFGLNNVRFLPLQPMEKLGELLGLADLHLLPQRTNASELVMPSKLTGMLASGRPIVAMAEPDTELYDVVSNCGLVSEPGDLASFALNIVKLKTERTARIGLGSKARVFALENLSDKMVLAKLEREMVAIANA